MKQKHLAIAILAAMAAVPVFADSSSDPNPSLPFYLSQNSSSATNIQGTNATGTKQNTVVDQNGNLKMVETPQSGNNTPTTSTVTTPGMESPGQPIMQGKTTAGAAAAGAAPAGAAPAGAAVAPAGTAPAAAPTGTAPAGTTVPATTPPATTVPSGSLGY